MLRRYLCSPVEIAEEEEENETRKVIRLEATDEEIEKKTNVTQKTACSKTWSRTHLLRSW